MSAKNSKSRRRTRAASNKGPDTPANLMDDWVINRRLNKLEQEYRNDQKNRPNEIVSSSIGGPRAEAIHYTVERLKQLVEEIKNVFEAEIEAGRVTDTAHLWATVYTELYLDALNGSTSRRVSRETLGSIAELLDNSPFAEPLDHLERSHRTQLAAYNSKHSREAIKSWTRLCSSSKFRSFARKALNRAAERCREYC